MAATTATAYHWVITLQKPIYNGFANRTNYGTLTAAPGETRERLFQQVIDLIISKVPEMAGANVLFFSLEPNEL
ncbi:hypothetical protein [Nocardiopsis sp. NPDC055824]